MIEKSLKSDCEIIIFNFQNKSSVPKHDNILYTIK